MTDLLVRVDCRLNQCFASKASLAEFQFPLPRPRVRAKGPLSRLVWSRRRKGAIRKSDRARWTKIYFGEKGKVLILLLDFLNT